ncbi:MAG TPA: transmembrane regulator PrtR, partial [Myxococcaceae bacterium]|nr:transmembrane regulator PrtR [Myxococcaceae bacterium]
NSHGYNVAIWRDREIVYELVSDLDESDIRQMVAQSASSPRRRSLVNEPRPAPTTSPPVLQTPSLVQPASLQH